MTGNDITAPIPLKNRTLSQLKVEEMKNTRSSSSMAGDGTKRPKLLSSEIGQERRPRSVTPTASSPQLLNGMDSKQIFTERLKHYGLDYVDDRTEHLKNIYDPESKWFSRAVKPPCLLEDTLPYKTESHKDQAKYLCHVLINLYIAIRSMDIQGLISISSKDLADLKDEVDNLALNTDLFRLSCENVDADMLNNDIADFDEDEDEEDMFDEYNEYIDLIGPDFNATGKITAKSASIINVNHWTNEFKNCMHFDFPLSLRKSLAVVYYYLSLVQGQKVYRQMHVEMFESLVSKDDDGTNFTDLLFDAGLRLDHSVMLRFLADFLPYPEPDYIRYDLTIKEDLQLFRLLLKLAHNSRAFYEDKSSAILVDSMEYLLSSLAPSTISTIMPMITSFVPYQYHEQCKITDFFPFCFGFWCCKLADASVDTHMYDFMGTVAEDAHWKLIRHKQPNGLVKYGNFLLFTDEQISFMFNRLQVHLRADGQIHSYSRTVRPLIYALNGSHSDSFFERLENLTKSIETFVHPSNSGFWTKPISKLVHGFIKMYHGRVQKEKKQKELGIQHSICVDSQCNLKLVDTFLGLLLLGAQNKSSDVANYYISCFAYLLDLRPENSHVIFDRILLDIYEALAGEYVNSTHRLTASLKQFNRVVRYMVMDKVYRVHVTNVLLMLVNKIDLNDIGLTSNLINGIVSIASFVPFQNFVSEDEHLTFESHTLPFIEQHYYHFRDPSQQTEFAYDEGILETAFKASTTVFENVLRVYIDKLFQLADVDLEEGFVTKVNQTTMIMQESMDDKTFKIFAKLLQKKFWDNDAFKEKDPQYDLVIIPLAALIRRDNHLAQPLFEGLTYHIREQIDRGAGSVRASSEIQQRDVKLVLYLSALNEVLRQSRNAILGFSGNFKEFMTYVFESVTNPPLDVITSIMIHSACASLTSTEVTDYRLFPEQSEIPLNERWGGLQFDKRKYEKGNLNFTWHVPNSAEITLAIDLLRTVTDYCVSNVVSMMAEPHTDFTYSDKIQKFILIITHALSGSSLLFDPDFNKNNSQTTSDWQYYKEKLILLKNVRENNFDSQELDIDIEQIRSEKGSDEYIDEKDSDRQVSEDSGVVEMKEATSEEIFMDEDATMSELPSGIATPEPGSHLNAGLNSSMNSRLAFRDLDIYTCNYYFGNTASEKLKHPQYLEVHQMRADIGKFLHNLHKFLCDHFENNTSMFQILLHGMKVWFTDVGQETVFIEDPCAFFDLDFIENIQLLGNAVEPLTRTCLAARANDLHQMRVLLHSTNRYPSKLETHLLRNIINLAFSVYPDIHKPAQGTLIHCMKQLIGSYSIIIRKAIIALKEVIQSRDYMKMQVILKLLMIKKIHRKLMSDYNNIADLTILLIECCKVNELEIAMYADKILNDIVAGLKIPSSICILDERAYTPLAPPDNFMDLQVEAVKHAKDKKRSCYLSLLVDLQRKLIGILENESSIGWKLPMIIIRFITKVQSHLEIRVDTDAVEMIFNRSKTNHPDMIHLAIKSFLGVFNKIFSLADYDYDVARAYNSAFDPDFIKEVNTLQDDFHTKFRKEMNNFDSPRYFVDSRMFVGWLCWGRSMKVVDSSPIEMSLKPNEAKAFEKFGNLVSYDWLQSMVSNLIQDNETQGVFSSGNVSFFVLLIYLISHNFTKLAFEDLFQLCEKHYDRNDKASMILSTEIFAALICGSKYMYAEDIKTRDKFMTRFLPSCINNELNQDAFGIWATLCWWLPTVVDLRRCAPFYYQFSNIRNLLDKKSDDPAHQASKLLMLRSVLLSMEYRAPDLSSVVKNLVTDHPYDQVREAVAKVLTTLMQSSSCASWPNVHALMAKQSSDADGLGSPVMTTSEELDAFVKKQFGDVMEESRKIAGLTPQKVLKTRYYYLTSTMIYWIKEMIKGTNRVLLVPYIVEYVAPFLLNLLTHRDVCKLAGIDPTVLYITLSYMPVRSDTVSKVVSLMCLERASHSSYQIKLKLGFVQHFFSSQLLQLTADQRDVILDFVVSHLYNEKYVEVRTRAADVLSDIVHNLGEHDKRLERLVQKFSKQLGHHNWEEKQKLSKADVRIHGSILGLGAIIQAFPYVFPLPRWIPQQLSTLASWSRTSGVAGTAAKTFISDFKKVRTDTWKFDRLSFTQEELEDLEGVLWSSYYA
ncbi:BLM10 (YFL007W) [Zygosaccharomyces parabailii]|nr:BLM10 (YFL007W) [Zygosaccharomyces parabailii]CDH09673.1 probable BLM10-Protein involved in nuclear assembly and or regulation of proteasomal core particles [Zygosaccharomyces bailii ISA1307]